MPTTKTATSESDALPNLTGLDYLKFFAAGAACCTLSHGAMVPIDVVKTRIQLEPAMAKLGMVGTGRKIVAQEGLKGLATGFGSTAVGYFGQGGLKFALNDFFKLEFAKRAGGAEQAVEHRMAIYLGAAAVAEFFADIFLAPLEAVRIRLVSDRTYATNLMSGFKRMSLEGGVRELYAAFVPLYLKQGMYSVGQFATNEYLHELAYKSMSPERQASLTTLEQTGLTLTCGIGAGVAAAVLSHPGDTLLSKINKGEGGKGSTVSKMVNVSKQVGFTGIWAGLGPRIVMTAGLVSSQFLLYGVIKDALGANKGVEIHKD
ncbi:hypothetical protein JCM3766R1_006967 [Sporobolomyces carnicolor]